MSNRIRLLLGRHLLELQARRAEEGRAPGLDVPHPRPEDAESLRGRAVEAFGHERAGRPADAPESIRLPLDAREQTILSQQAEPARQALMRAPPKNGGRKPG